MEGGKEGEKMEEREGGREGCKEKRRDEEGDDDEEEEEKMKTRIAENKRNKSQGKNSKVNNNN
ncbi:hypothetical protein E2C01_073044 [Portunus trituberculatus]|uniref:Uncharacterized protein n=1 Tax=Portunus trituberculatus TaxID=210409 RepID=A0A5B7I9I7_PORTR|nr:hypothetical protein [Portunus trituberculatus]